MTEFITAAIILIILAIIAAIRIVLGPTNPERIVALDATTTLIVGSLLCFSMAFNQPIIIDVAIVYALIGFGGILFLAKYLEGGFE